ncbi:MAG TPA: sigma-54 dependent transcriptional regulator [Sedimentisphaerales bacterium]|nr:sigma-54 dependent transcriptional regulator [Sedimentisphaerales bacterium]
MKTPKNEITRKALIVSDDYTLTKIILETLAIKGVHGIVSKTGQVTNLLERHYFNLIFDCTLQDNYNQFDLLNIFKKAIPQTTVIKIIKKLENENSGLIEFAVNAIKAGYSDFVSQGTNKIKIENIIDTYLPSHKIETVASLGTEVNIVGKSTKLNQTIELVKKLAPTTTPVLIFGESGTGKELIASLIHHKSNRASGPYIKVNCAALNDSLAESELFGHEKGAFTGAFNQRKGRFELADSGTLLLDEITEAPLKFQAKLLRVLEEQDFERVGGNINIPVDVRVISTTNKDIPMLIQQGSFRQDLYYRLCGIRLSVPPLRERNDDIEELTWHFVNLYAPQSKRRIEKLAPELIKLFKNHQWPGNIRQLRNIVRTSLILGTGPTLSLADASWMFDQVQPLPQLGNTNSTMLSNAQNNADITSIGSIPLERIEQNAIIETLKQNSGNQTRAAKILGISDRTLRDKMKRYRSQEYMQPAQIL